MLLLFQVCFFVGFGLLVISFIFGSLIDLFGFDGFDFDFLDIDFFLPINPSLCILFANVFGGIGWILMGTFKTLHVFIILVIALLAGLIICFLMNSLVIKPLKKAQNTSSPSAEELVGVKATVTERIVAGGYGEITYVVKGNSFNSPAKSTNGNEIKVGKDVAICWIEDNVYYVTAFDDINIDSK